MKKLLLPILAATALLSATAFANPANVALQSSLEQDTTTVTGPNSTMTSVDYHGTDSLAQGDPLGNNAVSAKDNAGPPSTRHTYEPGCGAETCVRAEKRWGMSTNWRQDRATGLSLGWGGERAQYSE